MQLTVVDCLPLKWQDDQNHLSRCILSFWTRIVFGECSDILLYISIAYYIQFRKLLFKTILSLKSNSSSTHPFIHRGNYITI